MASRSACAVGSGTQSSVKRLRRTAGSSRLPAQCALPQQDSSAQLQCEVWLGMTAPAFKGSHRQQLARRDRAGLTNIGGRVHGRHQPEARVSGQRRGIAALSQRQAAASSF